MVIIVNGEWRSVPETCTVADVVEMLGFAGRRIAVERNLAIVPRSQYAATMLEENDRVEIVHAVGGGSAPSCLPMW